MPQTTAPVRRPKTPPQPPPPDDPLEQAADMSIDVDRLDVEWLHQPMKVREVSDALADAKLTEQEAKQRLELVKAETHLDMLNDPAQFDLPKTTVDTMAAALLTQGAVQNAQKQYNRAVHRADLLRGWLNALGHRKSALESLTDLQGRDYFSTPRAKTEDARRHLHEATRRNVHERGRRPRAEDDEE